MKPPRTNGQPVLTKMPTARSTAPATAKVPLRDCELLGNGQSASSASLPPPRRRLTIR